MIDNKQFIQDFQHHSSNVTTEVTYLASDICRGHRTEQSNIVRNLRSLLTQLKVEMDGRTDGRNECALKWLEKVDEIDQPIPYI